MLSTPAVIALVTNCVVGVQGRFARQRATYRLGFEEGQVESPQPSNATDRAALPRATTTTAAASATTDATSAATAGAVGAHQRGADWSAGGGAPVCQATPWWIGDVRGVGWYGSHAGHAASNVNS